MKSPDYLSREARDGAPVEPAVLSLASCAAVADLTPLDRLDYSAREKARKARAAERWKQEREAREADLLAVVAAAETRGYRVRAGERDARGREASTIYAPGLAFPAATIRPEGNAYVLATLRAAAAPEGYPLASLGRVLFRARSSGRMDARAACLSFFLRLRAAQ